MSFNFKGEGGPHLVREEPAFDAETKQRFVALTYQGTEFAIKGLAPTLEAQGVSYNTRSENGVWEITTRIPTGDPEGEDDTNLDRWEIATEAHEVSIFQQHDVVLAARTYDATIATGDDTFRKLADRGASEDVSITTDPTTEAIFELVVQSLRDDTTSYETDNVVLRRFRRLSQDFAGGASGKFDLDTGRLIYTSAQLLVPGNVAFVLPTAPTGDFGMYVWGWKRRSQRVEIVGAFVEQTVEFLFAPWSKLFYSVATGNFAW